MPLPAACSWFFALTCSTGCALDPFGSARIAGSIPPQTLAVSAAPSTAPPVSDNPKAPPKGPVSLKALLEYAEANAPLLTVAASTEALGDAAVAGAQPLLPANPEIEVAIGTSTFVPNMGTYFQAGTAVSQRFEVGGERRLRIEAAERTRDVIKQQVSAAHWQIHQQVHALYYAGLVARERLDMADRSVGFAEQLLLIAERRMAAGETGSLELIVARAEVAQARQARVAARKNADVVVLQLAAIVGWPSDHPIELRGTLPKVRPAPELDDLLEKASTNQPLLLIREREITAAQARVASEDREAWPEPSVGVGYAREAQGQTGQFAHVVTGTVSIPIPFWRRNQGGRARARADLGIARAQQGAIKTTLSPQIATAKAAVDAAAERAAIYESEIVPAFDENLTKVLRAYELGEIEVVEVSQIQGRILDTQQAALQAWGDYYLALAQLEGLLGREIW